MRSIWAEGHPKNRLVHDASGQACDAAHPDDARRNLMKGQANNEMEKFGKRSEWLERGIWFAGGFVVAGLLMESGPEVGAAFAKHELPKAGTVGGSLVTIGVAAEVILGIFLAKVARRAQAIADATIAETHERAAKAGQAAAEANLARVQLERQLAWREIPAKDRDVIAERLSLFAGQQIGVCSSTGNRESMEFARHIVETLHQAGWNAKQMLPGSLDVGGYGNIFSYSTTSDEKSRAAISALLRELSPFAGAGTSSGLFGYLGPPPLIHLEVHDKVPLIRRPPDAG